MSAKYVIFTFDGVPAAVVFPSWVSHDRIKQDGQSSGFKEFQPLSAGFIAVENGKIIATGASETLGLSAQTQDTAILRATLNSIRAAILDSISQPAATSAAICPATGISPKQDTAGSSCGKNGQGRETSPHNAQVSARANVSETREPSTPVSYVSGVDSLSPSNDMRP